MFICLREEIDIEVCDVWQVLCQGYNKVLEDSNLFVFCKEGYVSRVLKDMQEFFGCKILRIRFVFYFLSRNLGFKERKKCVYYVLVLRLDRGVEV